MNGQWRQWFFDAIADCAPSVAVSQEKVTQPTGPPSTLTRMLISMIPTRVTNVVPKQYHLVWRSRWRR